MGNIRRDKGYGSGNGSVRCGQGDGLAVVSDRVETAEIVVTKVMVAQPITVGW
jgi:hypothetical protein